MNLFERQLFQIQDEGFGMFAVEPAVEPLKEIYVCANCNGTKVDWAGLPCGFCLNNNDQDPTRCKYCGGEGCEICCGTGAGE